MTPNRRLALPAAALLAWIPAAGALAHTPYLLPNTFNPERPRVTVQGALTEDDYFNPDIALNVPSFQVTLPSGEQTQVAPAATLKDVTLIEAPLDAPGTYRISTGQYAGRKQTLAQVDGKWLVVRQPRGGGPGGDGPPSIAQADVPAAAPRMESEQVQVVETYVSKGAPTDAALKTTGEGFELKPMNHPNALYVDQGFAFQLLVDGKPAAGAPISVYRSGNIYDDKRIAVETRSDAQGMVKVSFAQPGVYMLTTRYPAVQRKPDEAPPPHSYTYSLTFEVTR